MRRSIRIGLISLAVAALIAWTAAVFLSVLLPNALDKPEPQSQRPRFGR